MSLEDDIRSIAKEGSDVDSILGQIAGLNPLNGLNEENAFDVIKSNPTLLSAFDRTVSKRVETGVDNFKAKGMQEILKEREASIRAELNPKETPEQKRIRELEQKIANSEKQQLLNLRKDELALTAKDMTFDSNIARKLAGLDDAESVMQEIISWKDEILGGKLKNDFKTTPPKSGGKITGLPSLSDAELYNAAKEHPNQKAEILAEIKRRTMPK